VTTILCVPQWQGSASGSARRLVTGAHRTAELVPADRVVVVPVLDSAGQRESGVSALDVLSANQRLIGEAHAGIDDFVLTVGGECSVDIAPVSAARARYGEALTVLWIDAHPDVYCPETLPSGAFHGMAVRALLGDGDIPPALVPEHTLAPDRIAIVGERGGAESEHRYIEATGLRRYGVADIERAFEGVRGPVYVHVDLDVLDPAAFASTCYPEPGGPDPHRLAALIAGLDGVVGAAITEHAPADGVSPAEGDVIRLLGAALTRG
jgi:arginase